MIRASSVISFVILLLAGVAAVQAQSTRPDSKSVMAAPATVLHESIQELDREVQQRLEEAARQASRDGAGVDFALDRLGEIAGVVTDAATGEAVAGAWVQSTTTSPAPSSAAAPPTVRAPTRSRGCPPATTPPSRTPPATATRSSTTFPAIGSATLRPPRRSPSLSGRPRSPTSPSIVPPPAPTRSSATASSPATCGRGRAPPGGPEAAKAR